MKLSNRAAAGWAIAVFVVIGLVLLLIGVLEGSDTGSQQKPPVNRSMGSVR
ncbi:MULTISPECIES: hypothetical protein [unclassified Nocardioides]|uniref:hypothetical protein n=1 Tax=unclassified Nocardioides TaxID=2615069 RepID=UPI0030142029